jgi:replicative DNA helicase
VVDLERALLTKVCEEGDWTEIVRNKITGKHFTNFDCRQVFDWLREQFNTHGELPSVGVLRTEFPDFSTESTRSGQKTLIARIRDRKIYADIHKTVQEVITEAREDPSKGLDKLRASVLTLTTDNVVDNEVDASADLSSADEAYDKAKRTKGLLGIPWPWPSLTTLTGGIEAGEFIGIYGPPGVMKTWLLLYIAMHCLAFGKTAVFFTWEMTKEQVVARYAAMLAKVEWSHFRGGCMTEEEESRFRKTCREVGKNPPFHIIELEEAGPSAIAKIKAKIKEHGADIAFIDGLSFVAEDLGWEAFGTTCKELRTLARNTKVSVIATHHSNRNRKKVNKLGNDAEDVALGDTLQRYATQLYRLVRAPRQEENDEIIVTAPKLRESKRKTLTIHAKPAWDFSEKYFDDVHDLAERGGDSGEDIL